MQMPPQFIDYCKRSIKKSSFSFPKTTPRLLSMVFGPRLRNIHRCQYNLNAMEVIPFLEQMKGSLSLIKLPNREFSKKETTYETSSSQSIQGLSQRRRECVLAKLPFTIRKKIEGGATERKSLIEQERPMETDNNSPEAHNCFFPLVIFRFLLF